MKPLATPRPIYHVYGPEPCRGICCLTTIDADWADDVVESFGWVQCLDGTPWIAPTNRPKSPYLAKQDWTGYCESCGERVQMGNLMQMVPDNARKITLDPFAALVKTTLLRSRRAKV